MLQIAEILERKKVANKEFGLLASTMFLLKSVFLDAHECRQNVILNCHRST